MASGQDLLTLNGHKLLIYDVAFSPDGNHLATASDDRTARVWDLTSGQNLLTLRAGHEDSVYAVTFSPDGKSLAIAKGETAQVWDANSGQELLKLPASPNLPQHHVARVLNVAFSPDGKRVATASDDGDARVWDAASGQELLTLHGHGGPVYSVGLEPGRQSPGDGEWGPYGQGVGCRQ